jgi:hypothetical protein
MNKQKDMQFAKELGKYADKWVALKVKGQRIVASGKTMQEVQEQVEKNQEKDYVYHLVPSKPLIMYET